MAFARSSAGPGSPSPSSDCATVCLAPGLSWAFLWGVWHFLVNFWSSGNSSGALSTDLLVPSLIFSVGILPVYRVLMVWVYDHTGSVLVAMLMHAGLIFSTLFVLKPAVTGAALSTYYVILTAVLWVVVAGIAVINGGRLEVLRQTTAPAS